MMMDLRYHDISLRQYKAILGRQLGQPCVSQALLLKKNKASMGEAYDLPRHLEKQGEIGMNANGQIADSR